MGFFKISHQKNKGLFIFHFGPIGEEVGGGFTEHSNGIREKKLRSNS